MEISGFENALRIFNVHFKAEVNRHTECRFDADIRSGDISNYALMTGKTVSVKASNGNELMEGIVRKVEIRQGFHDAAISVLVTSKTFKLDETFHKRIFQNTKKTGRDILNNYSGDFSISYQKAEHIDDEIPEIIVQNNISDFDFIRYAAALCECGVWIDNDDIIIGSKLNSTVTFSLNSDDYMKNVLDLTLEYKDSEMYISFSSMEYAKAGTLIKFRNKNADDFINVSPVEDSEFIIFRCEAMSAEAGTYYKYNAVRNDDGLDFSSFIIPSETAVICTAKVLDNKDSENLGRIQAEYMDYEDMTNSPSNNYWADYITPFVGKDKGGFVMLPDTGDIVRIMIYDGHASAIGSVRQQAIIEKCSDVDKKSIMVGTKQLIQFDEKAVRIENTEDTTVIAEEDNILVKVSDSQIKADTSSITVKHKDESVITVQDKNINSYAGKGSIDIKDNIEIKTTDSVITLKNKNISSKAGNGSIDIKDNIEIKTTGSVITLKNRNISSKAGSGSVDIKDNIKIKGVKIQLDT